MPNAAPPPTYGIRQPLLDRQGRLAGFEFSLGAVALADRRQRPVEQVAQSAHLIALLASMQASLQTHRVAMTSLPLAILSRPNVLQKVPSGVMLALTDGPWASDEATAALAALRQRGAQLGGCGTPIAGGQFVLLDATAMKPAALSDAASAARQASPGIFVVATGIAAIDEIEAALAAGIDWVSGQVAQRERVYRNAALPSHLHKVCSLVSQVLRDDVELSVLADALRADVGLSYQLLRHVNSAWLALPRPAASIDDAVMLLGRDGVYRWLTQMLLAGADTRPSSHALQEIAMARARLLEMLALRSGQPPTPHYTAGLLSLLDVMLQVPMAKALAPLNLPAEAVQALAECKGPWRGGLDLALAFERGDLETAARLAEPWGGFEFVAESADAAWRWARKAAAVSADQ